VTFFAGHQGGQLTDAFYRAVATFPGSPIPSHIFGAIQVRMDADGPDTSDLVYIGITQGDGGLGAYLLVIPPEPASTPPVSGSVPHDPVFPRPNNPTLMVAYTRSQDSTLCPGGIVPCWLRLLTVPTWLENTATWLGSPGVSWAITFEIDTKGIGVGNNPRVYLGVGISEPADAGASPNFVTLASGTQVAVGTGIGNTVVPQDPATWPVLQRQVGQACGPGAGVYSTTIGVLADGGVTTAEGGTNPINTSPGAANTFRVEIRNVPPTLAATPFGLRARLRVSNWPTTVGDPSAVWDSCGVGTEVFTMDSSAFTSPPWTWSSQPDAGIVDIDYTCSVDGGVYCPSPSNGATQSRQIILADIGPAQTAGPVPIQNAQAYRDVYYRPPLSISVPAPVRTGLPVVPITRSPPACGCDVVGGDGWSVAALGGTGLGAALFAVRGLRRRRRSSTGG
jgi:hypothetical protein